MSRIRDLARALDALMREGAFAFCLDARRSGLDAVVERERCMAVGQRIVAGYSRIPQLDDLGWPDSSSAAMIAEEPW